MNYTKYLKEGLDVQDLKLEIKDTPVNIYLKHTGDILRLCFIEKETVDCLIVSETTARGTEEIRIVPKDNVEFVGIFYDFGSLEPKKQDKMII